MTTLVKAPQPIESRDQIIEALDNQTRDNVHELFEAIADMESPNRLITAVLNLGFTAVALQPLTHEQSLDEPRSLHPIWLSVAKGSIVKTALENPDEVRLDHLRAALQVYSFNYDLEHPDEYFEELKLNSVVNGTIPKSASCDDLEFARDVASGATTMLPIRTDEA